MCRRVRGYFGCGFAALRHKDLGLAISLPSV
jgi:hypothetical protein